jgi:hypothetical protein
MTNILQTLMLNRNIIDGKILITLRNRLLKGYVEPLMTFLIFGGSWHVADDAPDLQI